MRRIDRAQDRAFSLALIDRCTHGVMALTTGEAAPYCLPLSFVRVGDELYFHCAREGRKIDLMRTNAWAGFEMDTGFSLHEAEKACGWSAAFCSVTGGGEITFLEEPEAKRRALGRIMAHLSGREDWDFPDGAVEGTCVYQLEVRELSCKEHL